MLTITVDLGKHTYPIHIGTGLIDDASLFAPYLQGSSIAIVTNTTVEALYAKRLANTLAPLGKRIIWTVLPDGEAHKDWETLNLVFAKLLAERADRKTTLIALGGGVVGDITGFAAACYMRGVPFLQVPTTLLAQVDSSVGGKTGINHPLGKNMIGAFYQPQAVIADISLLRTLPPREMAAGIAEVIKISAVTDPQLFGWLEANIDQLNQCDEEATSHAVHLSCMLKSSIVAADEREQGRRGILNFGHTFGHAIEAGLGYGQWLHGEAVGCGMVMAADLSVRLGLFSDSERLRLVNLITAANLPIRAPELGAERYINLMQSDKKTEAGKINFVLLKRIGEALISEANEASLNETLMASVLSHN